MSSDCRSENGKVLNSSKCLTEMKHSFIHLFVWLVGLISLSQVCSLRQITMNFGKEKEKENNMSNKTYIHTENCL